MIRHWWKDACKDRIVPWWQQLSLAGNTTRHMDEVVQAGEMPSLLCIEDGGQDSCEGPATTVVFSKETSPANEAFVIPKTGIGQGCSPRISWQLRGRAEIAGI